jgi:hypothetical protein
MGGELEVGLSFWLPKKPEAARVLIKEWGSLLV